MDELSQERNWSNSEARKCNVARVSSCKRVSMEGEMSARGRSNRTGSVTLEKGVTGGTRAVVVDSLVAYIGFKNMLCMIYLVISYRKNGCLLNTQAENSNYTAWNLGVKHVQRQSKEKPLSSCSQQPSHRWGSGPP